MIEAVRRVSGRTFAVNQAPRRPGDIMAMIAETQRIRAALNWTPQFDNLEVIAAHALRMGAKAPRRTRDHPARGSSGLTPFGVFIRLF